MNTAYVFANRGATRLKVLVADSAGLWLCTRRLGSRSRFVWPDEESVVEISPAQWDWLVAGTPWQHVGHCRPITVV